MPNFYLDRYSAKKALSIPVTSTADDAVLDTVIEGVSRLMDDYVGFPLFASLDTQFYTASDARCLVLDQPVTDLTSVALDPGGTRTYSQTMGATCYDLTGAGADYNVRTNSPPQPFWEVHTRWTSSAVFPERTPKGVQLTGTWGYTNQTRTLAATPTTVSGWDATSTSLNFVNASTIAPGQTLLVDSEQLFVKDAVSTSGFYVERGVNGTSGAVHTSAAVVKVYEYPVISEACRFQIALTWRAKDMSGYGGDQGVPSRAPSGGLHPFTKSMLTMRSPVAK
jgi:hypothetical protein